MLLGDPANPLLVSVRSGAAVSMPGMMETILNLGLNDRTGEGLIAGSKNPRFAYDSYRRFVQMYGDVVFDLGKEEFEAELDKAKARRKVKRDIDLPADDLHDLVHDFKTIVKKRTGHPFPDDPQEQLWGAIEAVFKSWHTKRAKDYRQLNNSPDSLGTAVNIVAMVYGNMGDDCGTGVAFTRDCSTGERVLNGDYLTNAQGEDVVSGARTPEPIAKMKRAKGGLSKVYRDLERLATKLENHFKDVQDVEFTFEHYQLYMLQTRRAQRTGAAAVRIGVEMVGEGRRGGRRAGDGKDVRRRRAGARRRSRGGPVPRQRPRGQTRADHHRGRDDGPRNTRRRQARDTEDRQGLRNAHGVGGRAAAA